MLLKFAVPAVLLAFAVSAPAYAEKADFHYSAQALAAPGGAEALYDRIKARVKSACADATPAGVWARRAAAACEEELTADLVGKIGDGRLAAVHEQMRERRYTARF
ncbi:MAG: UrcA family protein [Parvularculaceae bacterium]